MSDDDTNDPGFSENEKRVLACVLDQTIPPSEDGRLPGAGQLGLVGHVDEALRKTPELRLMVRQALSALDDLARRHGSQSFAAFSKQEQLETLNELESTEHAFPPILTLHVYTGYYQHPRVLEALGLEPRPPHPKGYEMEPDDLTPLDRVRQSPRLYRLPPQAVIVVSRLSGRSR